MNGQLKVLLIGSNDEAEDAGPGAFRHALHTELVRLGCDVRVLTPKPLLRSRVSPGTRWANWLGCADRRILFLPALVRESRWADIVHITDHADSGFASWLWRRPSVATCEALLENNGESRRGATRIVELRRKLRHWWLRRMLRRPTHVACASDTTRFALTKPKLVHGARVSTVLGGLNARYGPMPMRLAEALIERHGLPLECAYLVNVGSDASKKNRSAVVQTFIALHRRAIDGGSRSPVQRLVLVGPDLDPLDFLRLQEHQLEDKVVVLQGVSHEELQALYCNAAGLLAPALSVGFGRPMLEAQACGCPVFASDIAPMNELGGVGVVYVDPQDPDAMAQAIEDSVGQFAPMRQLALDHSVKFDPRRVAERYVALYRQLIGEARRTSLKTDAACMDSEPEENELANASVPSNPLAPRTTRDWW